MDYRGKTLLGLTTFALFITTAAAASGDRPILQAMHWLVPEGQLEALSSEPASGFRVNEDMLNQSDQILVGQVIFHTPSLLGGQAAKARISCASCHAGGRDNPHFQFPGISGAAGTADVTHSFFSSHRGDREFNPVPIPDLSKPGKISRDREDQSLEKFIRGLIVEEFDGAVPAPETLNALGSYIRALCAKCGDERRPVTLETHLRPVQVAVKMAAKYESRNPELTRLLIAGARYQLGLIHERYAGNKLKKERAMLKEASAKLLDLEDAIGVRSNRYYQVARSFEDGFERLRARLAKKEDRSLYNSSVLEVRLSKLQNQ